MTQFKTVLIDATKITDWEAFHKVFAEAFGFPDFYGKNMDAWIDCMSYIDDEAAGMTKMWINQSDTLVIHLKNSAGFCDQHGDIFNKLLECVAFVNGRRIEDNGPIIAVVAD